jgi:hypothetical protein
MEDNANIFQMEEDCTLLLISCSGLSLTGTGKSDFSGFPAGIYRIFFFSEMLMD